MTGIRENAKKIGRAKKEKTAILVEATKIASEVGGPWWSALWEAAAGIESQ